MSVLSSRYASEEMKRIFSPENKIIAERRLWIKVAKTQSELGAPIDIKAIKDYEAVIEKVDLASIDNREKTLRHDVKARIEEFNELAGHEIIHAGMTSRDLTENIEIYQIKQGLELVRDRAVATLAQLKTLSEKYKEQPITGRSHNVPAQLTTLGKRFSSASEELLFAFGRLENLIETLPIRGIKGPVGTAQDSLDFLGGSGAHEKLEKSLLNEFGFENSLDSTGQIYPRSIDFDCISTLVQIVAAPSSLATSIRLMAGAELVTEGFKAGQVGSSAMPHKMNTRSCERVNGLAIVLRGYLSMVSELAGSQWNEGDVSCSVVRRVAIADAFYAVDGLFQTFLTVLNEFGIFPEMIAQEIKRNLPFLATTKFLVAAVKNGVGREQAHAAIKEHSIAASLTLRAGGENNLLELLAKDSRLNFSIEQLNQMLANPMEFTGDAINQVERVNKRIDAIVNKYPQAAKYLPGNIR